MASHAFVCQHGKFSSLSPICADLHMFTLTCIFYSSKCNNLQPLNIPLPSTTTATVRSITRRAVAALTCPTSLRRTRKSSTQRCSWRRAADAASTHTTRSRYSTDYTHRCTRARTRISGRTQTSTCKHIRSTRERTRKTRMATVTSERSIRRAHTHASSRSRFPLGRAPGRYHSGVMTNVGELVSSGLSIKAH